MICMISLSDSQLQTVMTAARVVDVDRRSIFLQRTAAMLRMRGNFSDSDLNQVVSLALQGLVQSSAETAA
jgi:hypothetical protein